MEKNIDIKISSSAHRAVHINYFLTYLSQCGYFDLNEYKTIFLNNNPHLIKNKRTRAIILAGYGKILSLEGNFTTTLPILKEALTIAKEENTNLKDPYRDEILAYILYELGLFHRLMHELEVSKEFFNDSFKHVESPNLESLLIYQLETINTESRKNPDTSKLEELVNVFLQKKMFIMYSIGLQRLGIINRLKGEFEKAREFFDTALSNAYRYNYKYLIWTINNSIGYLNIELKKYDQALELFEDLAKQTKSYYLKVLILENIALIHFYKENYSKAVDYYFRALNLSLDHNVISQIPNECISIGDCYERYLNKPQKAKYFYKLGYDYSLQQVEQGLHLSGPRLKAVRKYMDFLQKYYPEEEVTDEPELFEFAIGKTWQEIKNLFHYNLMLFHKIHSTSLDEMFNVMKIKKTTYYSEQSKLKREGYKFPDFRTREVQFPKEQLIEPLQIYIQSFKDKSWEVANKTFEKDVFYFLFKKYGYRKTRLMEVLKLSYPVVIAKTKAFTSVDSNYLNRTNPVR